jgi:hypothetical protein
MATQLKLKSLLLMCLTALSVNAFSSEEVHWLNKWDSSCYQNGVNTCREDWYSIPQGSHLLKWEVFNTIESENSQELFSSKASLSQYGFLYPETPDYNSTAPVYDGSYEEQVEGNLNQYGLPLGFVKDKSQLNGRNYLGLTCAACHTGKVTYGENTYYVEAGQANADMIKFLNKLSNALKANKNDWRKLYRFKRRFAQYTWSNIDITAWPVNVFSAERYLDSAIEYVSNYAARNTTAVENGPARLDAIGAILNQVHIEHAGKDVSEATPLTAPVSYPYIWNVSSLECVQTNCLASDPVSRNLGEVLGVFGYANIDDDDNIPDTLELIGMTLGLNDLFKGTPKVDNLYDLEVTLSKASPPKWPSTFPPLDTALVDQGYGLYNTNCAGCHTNTSDGIDPSELTAPNSIGRQFTKVNKINYDLVGTDEAFAVDYGLRKERSGILGSVIASQAPDSVDPETGIPFGESFPETFNALVLLGADVGAVLNKHQTSLGFIAKAGIKYPHMLITDAVAALKVDYALGNVDRAEIQPTAYRAKPLEGIAFTGPFLHNGSVRTLKDLLNAPEDRATSFLVGSTEYDVDGAGYKDEGHFLLDTSIRGNGKGGHIYGTQLSSDNKTALLEYLKSI